MNTHIVTDQEYLASLPPKGLDLAQTQLQEYLADARQDSELPTRDATVDLILIRTIRQESEVTS